MSGHETSELKLADMSRLSHELQTTGIVVSGHIPGVKAGKLVVAGLIGDGGEFQTCHDTQYASIVSTITAQAHHTAGRMRLQEQHLMPTHKWGGEHYVDLSVAGASGVSAKASAYSVSGGVILNWPHAQLALNGIESGETQFTASELPFNLSHIIEEQSDGWAFSNEVFGIGAQDFSAATPEIIPIEDDNAEAIATNFAELFHSLGSSTVAAAVMIYDTDSQEISTHTTFISKP